MWEASPHTQDWADPSPLQLVVIPYCYPPPHTPQLSGHRMGSERAMEACACGELPQPIYSI